MLTIYARKEPTNDRQYFSSLGIKNTTVEDVCFYYDESATMFAGRRMWHYAPIRKDKKTIMLNCMKYNLVWLADL